MIFKFKFFFFLVLGLSLSVSNDLGQRTRITWSEYKLLFNKTYRSKKAEETARQNYARNLASIRIHNAVYKKGLVPYGLSQNQFTDMSFGEIKAIFSPTLFSSRRCNSTANFTMGNQTLQKGYQSKIQDQGLKCSTGWAYAAATALDIFRAISTSTKIKSVSAQHLIDCPGYKYGCTNQTSFEAFSYLARTRKHIYDESDYPNTPSIHKKKCASPKRSSNETFALQYYYLFCDIKRPLLRRIIKNISPVVFEFGSISFEFIHYAEGIFRPPDYISPGSASHYMTVIGYGKVSNVTKYWKIQNSFGTKWGEDGYLRLSYEYWPITHRVLFPTSLIQNN